MIAFFEFKANSYHFACYARHLEHVPIQTTETRFNLKLEALQFSTTIKHGYDHNKGHMVQFQ